ncbi:MAG: sulfite exporter TauE/SafE family protein [Oscillospiraceae bacterium]|nr:sulfite exporter TauE/SafE family protein [Oscillospiraceae bacterium]
MTKNIHFNISGMTCINCQNKIESSLNSTDGVIHASVSFSKGCADIEYDQIKISEEDIIRVIEDLDYKVLLSDTSASFDIVNSVSILAIIIALYYILQSLGILNHLVPRRLADTGMGYGMLFMIGLITSVHCIAMCGGINLSQSLPKMADYSTENAGKFRSIQPSLLYNLGRVCSYTAIGFLLGLIGMILSSGSDIGVSSLLQGLLKIIAGLFMVVMGINMLGVFPWLRKFSISMPRFISSVIWKKRRTTSAPFVVGLLNGFMPCGPLQSMWIVALATGNPFDGALSMFLFSAGTVPLMLGLGSVVSLLGKKYTDQMMRAGAILVVVMGLSMLSQGGSLSGWLPPDMLLYLIIAFSIAGVLLSLPNRKRWMRYAAYAASIIVFVGAFALWTTSENTSESRKNSEGRAQILNGIQVVNSTLSPGSYPDIIVQEGIPVRWTIEASDGSVNGCNYRMLIQDYGIEHTFGNGENVIEFVPEKAGVVRYSCWMGMIHGNIYIVENL